MSKSFGIEGNSLINLFSEDNPILSVGNKCFFIFNNIHNIHIPLIGYGEVVNDKFTNGMDKIYAIKLLKIHNNDFIVNNHVINNTFNVCGLRGELFKKNRNVKLNTLNWKNSIYNINCFFVRTSLMNINNLHSDYVNIIKEDLNKQILELEQF